MDKTRDLLKRCINPLSQCSCPDAKKLAQEIRKELNLHTNMWDQLNKSCTPNWSHDRKRLEMDLGMGRKKPLEAKKKSIWKRIWGRIFGGKQYGKRRRNCGPGL
jgi:hypothetical protein